MTVDQHIASNPGISVWVSASAGTGKTKVLTDRVLRLLLAGAKPSKILCITYTKAAAAEMEHRIEAQLGNWAVAEDEELFTALSSLTGAAPDEKTIQRARRLFALVLDSPERLRIQTIHGFCQSVLKRFPLEAGIAPHFTLIDEHTTAELLDTARNRLFTDSGNEAVATAIEALAGMVGEYTFNRLLENIIQQRSRFGVWFDMGGTLPPSELRSDSPAGSSYRTPPRPHARDLSPLLQAIYKETGCDPASTEESLLNSHFNYLPNVLTSLREACAALSVSDGKTDRDMAAALQAWLESPPHITKCADYIRAFLTAEDEPRKKLCTQSAEKSLAGLKDILLAEQQRVLVFANALKSLRVAVSTRHLVTLAEALLGLYRGLKERHGYMDYDDLIDHTVKLFTQRDATAWVLFKLDGGIDHLLVDEAQDTSPYQWRLVDALTSEFFAGTGAVSTQRTLFVVGDGKQSIYSFQGAVPMEFDRMQHLLRKRVDTSGMEFRNVQLALSFRSTQAVLNAVDTVFASADARDGLVFSENYVDHTAHRMGMAGRVELWPLTELEASEALPAWHVSDRQIGGNSPEVMLAERIAVQTRQWIDSGRKLASQDRPVRAGDILILVQRRGDFTSAMISALKKYEVPVAGADRLVLTEHIAVADCIALGHFLLLPQDDLTLATILKSPLIGLSEEDIFELAYARGEQTLWQRLKANAKFTDAYEFLSGILAKTDYLAPYELFSHVLDTLGGRRKLAQRLGAEIHDPLNEFLSLALEYTTLHTPSLQGFLHWLASGVNEIKRDLENAGNEVRIMTVHGSKGLQAPIVFLPDTTRLPRPETGILWSSSEPALPLWSTQEDSACRRIRETIRLDREREYRRLLYVAMTRAEDELYICGWKGIRQISDKCWYAMAKSAAEQGAWSQEPDGRRILLCEQSVPPKYKQAAAQQEVRVELPGWALTPPAPEPAPSRPLSPSRMDEGPVTTSSPLIDTAAMLRGQIIHRMLQHLPDVAPAARMETAARLIHHYAQMLEAPVQEAMLQEVLTVLESPDFAPLFHSTSSIAEAPVSGIVENQNGQPVVVSGQIDRLTVSGDEVYIIDYKTGLHVPENEAQVHEAYVRQMEAYKRLISRIYPDKTIRCALLWTAAPKLMVLSL
ncbi:MAG TPA: double-strand break repair helicase AddA [Rickettsiales bacterium]|nr:double-strand break repair helicase AddA [Rickettsiales bacterium]